MSSSNGRIPEATEIVQLPRPSWAPLFFAFGVTLAICGLFLEFMGPNWAYCVIGGVFALAALRSMIQGATRDYFRLPRRQATQSATLPADSLRAPSRPKK